MSSSGRKVRGTVALAGGVKEVVGQAKLSDGAEEGDGRGGARRWSRGMGGRRQRRREQRNGREDLKNMLFF